MESGSNKFDDLSGASEPAKFDRKTLIDSTPCTEQDVNVQSTGLPGILKDEMEGYLLQLPKFRKLTLLKLIQRYATRSEENILHSLARHNAQRCFLHRPPV